jgi:hypothetical protein
MQSAFVAFPCQDTQKQQPATSKHLVWTRSELPALDCDLTDLECVLEGRGGDLKFQFHENSCNEKVVAER